MRVLVISDIHGNANALQSVLANAGAVDAVWCLGDVVGYGPDPNECVSLLKDLPKLVCLQGNHDAAAVGELALDGFNIEARNSIEWLREQLSSTSIAFLKGLEPRQEVDGVTLAHASPRQPVLEYLLDTYSAAENFAYFGTDICFVGHTHIPVLFILNDEGIQLQIPEANCTYTLERRTIANPGSVGQPRDRDPRAAYAIYDDQTRDWDYRRIPYNIPEVQKRMRSAGLPERHVNRLGAGW